MLIYPHALGAGAEQDAPPSAMPWESLVLSPQEAWEAFLAQGWEKTVFARPPHSSVFVRPRPCSQGLCLGRSSLGLVSEDRCLWFGQNVPGPWDGESMRRVRKQDMCALPGQQLASTLLWVVLSRTKEGLSTS